MAYTMEDFKKDYVKENLGCFRLMIVLKGFLLKKFNSTSRINKVEKTVNRSIVQV